MNTTDVSPTLTHRLGTPTVVGALSVFPVFGPPVLFDYLPLATALTRGARISELPSGPSVRDVLITNPTGEAVLVYEGQQILGALQNRSFDRTILVPAYTELPVPVSCIEQGRWNHGGKGHEFTVSPHAADPALRAAKRQDSNRSRRDGRADQGRVWAAVDERLARFGRSSQSASLEEMFAGPIDGKPNPAAITHQPGQVGALASVAGRPVALDIVSREPAFAELLPALVEGYALQAVGAQPRDGDAARAERFLRRALTAHRMPAIGGGLGASFTLGAARMEGAGLRLNAELIALSAFRVAG
jgi:hypothetical protein